MTDRPEPGKVYALTGSRSIAAGDNWQGSRVFCAGWRDSLTKRGTSRHTRKGAEMFGCTPHKCGAPREIPVTPFTVEQG